MSSVYGINRLFYEDARWFIGKLLLLYITLPLAIAWTILAVSVDLGDTLTSIAGPAYFFFIPAYGILAFKGLLPIAMGIGSTRTQLLKTFYLIGTSAILAYILFLNVFQLVIASLYHRGIASSSILHPGLLHSQEYLFLPYLWIDLMFALAMFGGAFFIYCLTYRVGITQTLIATMVIGISAMFLYYSGMLEGPIEWLLSLDMSAIAIFTVAGVVGLSALLATYPLMKNASLLPKGKKE